MRRLLTLFTLGLLLLSGCRDTEPFELEMQGQAVASFSGEPLAGVEIELWEKVLDGGSLSSTPELAASAVSDADGQFQLSFERKNALEYDLRYEGLGLVSGNRNISPEDVKPGSTYCITLAVPEASSVSTRLVNVNPEADNDEVRFRFLNAVSSCVCCDTTQVVQTGTDVDYSWTCIEHAGVWLRYFVEIDRASGGSFVLDSLQTVAGENQELLIEY